MAETVVICSKCGRKVTSESTYCRYCGWLLKAKNRPDD